MTTGDKNKIDRIHDEMPRFFKTRQNPNWKALIESIGQSDQSLTDLIEEVRKQFFIKTAERPYIDRLGNNVKVSRPRLIGMDDITFRQYIPILAYQPKQVKLVLDLLLDIFFFKDTTTAFTQSDNFEPYSFKHGWKLEYTVDGTKSESIEFEQNDFTDISNTTANEVVSLINKKAQHSFAVIFDDRVKKKKFIRIFTNTVGSKGAIRIDGGRANTNLRFTGYNYDAGSGPSTIWDVKKIGDTVIFKHIGGVSPGIGSVSPGDTVIIDIPGNEGSFKILDVDAGESTITFNNIFATPGVFDQSNYPGSKVRFITPTTSVVYKNSNRAIVWETSPSEIIIEMPASPPAVKRRLEGSAHVNGLVNTVVNTANLNELELDTAEEWPLNGGKFMLQEQNEIKKRILTDFEDNESSDLMDTRFDNDQLYSYTHKEGNILKGISPDLPQLADIFQFNISSLERRDDYSVLVKTSEPHGLKIGEQVKIQNTESLLPLKSIRIDVYRDDNEEEIARKTSNKINSLFNNHFNVSYASSIVEIQNTEVGESDDAVDIDAGVNVVISQQGDSVNFETTQLSMPNGQQLDNSKTGSSFEISSANNEVRYRVWFYVIDSTYGPQYNPNLDDTNTDGTFTVKSIVSDTEFTYTSSGELGFKQGGVARTERIRMSQGGSLVYLTSSRLDTGIYGPNLWDASATFVLSALTSNITDQIRAGNTVKTLNIDPSNQIPDERGFIVFGFGTEKQEGPVRYLFKPTSSSVQIDPSYVFENSHAPGTSITVIRRRGAHVISSLGKEFAPYITDPGVAREVLQDLLRQTKSVGFFLNFLVRFPEQLYATLDVYRSNNSELYPINQDDQQ